jgi:hypothetical protein
MLHFVFGVVSCLGAFGVMGVVCLAPVGMKVAALVMCFSGDGFFGVDVVVMGGGEEMGLWW